MRREEDGTLVGHRNHQGRSWLHALVIARNARALSIIVSPRGGMAWWVANMIRYHRNDNEMPQRTLHSETRDLKGRSLRDTARLLGCVEIEKMIDEFAAFYKITHLHKSSDFNVDDDLSKFSGEDPSLVARRLLRFSDELLTGGHGYAHTLRPIRSEISYRIEQGHASVVTWLIQADPSLLDLKPQSIRTRVNMNEFAQFQVHDSKASEDATKDMDLVSLAAHGPGPHESDYLLDGCCSYSSLLSDFVNRGGFRNQGLTSFISTAIDDKAFIYKDTRRLEYKLSLLRDDECLEDRLQLLHFFVSEIVGLIPPDAVEVVRWRKCGILRWLVAESFVRLEALALPDMQIAPRLKYVTFLGKSTVPSSMTVGEFLLIAAIEFDDLQSVQWLIEDCETRAVEIRCNVWNIMHRPLWSYRNSYMVPLSRYFGTAYQDSM